MRATGIVRRVDDLGRIVIPKEIRQSLKIKDGEPLQLLIGSEGEIIFEKINPEEKSLTMKDIDVFFKKHLEGDENININDRYQIGFYNAVRYLWGEISNYLENK